MQRFAVLAMLLLVSACATDSGGASLPPPRPAAPPPARVEPVELVITGTAEVVDLTMTNASGGTDQISVNLPYARTLRLEEGDFVAVLAQNRGDRGRVECEITQGGRVLSHATATVAYGIASCDASVE